MGKGSANYKHFIPEHKLNSTLQASLVHNLVDTEDKWLSFLNKCKSKGDKLVIAYDSETNSLDPSTPESELVGFSVAIDNQQGYYIPLKHKIGNNIPNPSKVLDQLVDLLKSAKLVAFYNYRFDARWLQYQGYDIQNIKYYDVSIGIWFADSNVSMPSLKWAERHFLGLTPDNFEETLGGAENFAMTDPKQSYQYASMDALGTMLLLPVSLGFFKASQISGKLDNKVLYPLMQFENEGISIDRDWIHKLIDKARPRMEFLRKRIFSAIGYEFSLQSPKQLGDALMSIGVNTKSFTSTGQMKTDLITLQNLESDLQVIKDLIEHSRLQKLIGSYLETLDKEAARMNGKCRFSYLTTRVPCLTESAMVTIKGKGLVSIKTVKEGDYIWTQYGWKKVLWNNSHWSDDIWKLELRNGRTLTGTGEHPILVNQSGINSIWEPIWCPIQSLTNEDAIVLNHSTVDNYEFEQVEYPSLRSDILSRNTFTIPEFSSRVARILGFLDGKGSISKGDRVTLTFNSKEPELIEFYVKEFSELFGIQPHFEVVSDNNSQSAEFFSKQLRNFLYDLGAISDTVPKIVMESNPECWANYIAGLCDACGEVIFNKGYYDTTIKMVSKESYLKDVQLILINLGITAKVTRCNKESDVSQFKLSVEGPMGRGYFRDLIALGLISNEKGSRLFSNPIESFYIGSLSYPVNIEKQKGGAVVYDIEVEDVHEYVANGIVTHNTARLASGSDKKNSFFAHINVQSIGKPHPLDYYIHTQEEFDNLNDVRGNELYIPGYVCTPSNEDNPRKSNRIEEGFDQDGNLRSAFKPDNGCLWVSIDYCLSPYTLIKTRDGEKPMKDLKHGEEVLTSEGYRKCINPHYTGVKQVVKIRTKSGKELVCSPDHRVIVQRGRTQIAIKVSEMRKTDRLVEFDE